QHHAGVGVGGGEGHGALIIGIDLAVWVQGRERDVEGRTRDGGRRGRDQEMVGRHGHIKAPDLVAIDLGEPDVSVGAGRYTKRPAAWRWDGELGEYDSVGGDL